MGYLLGIIIFLALLGVCVMGLQRANKTTDDIHRRNRDSASQGTHSSTSS